MRPRSLLCALGALTVLALAGPAVAASTRTWIACPAEPRMRGCDFRGDLAIQAAVDRARSGDEIRIRAGRYAPAAYRDVRYEEITVRAYVLVEGKDLSIVGESGAILDGSTRLPTTAIAVHRANVELRNLEITGFRYDVQEDDTYEGHGVFVIDGTARIDNVSIRKFQKMGLTGRGRSLLDVSNLQVLDGHVGIWLRESTYLRLRNSTIRGNDSSAIAAYVNSVAHIFDCVFEGNQDDGLYSDNQATLYVMGSRILRNRPIGVNAVGNSRIWLSESILSGNAQDTGSKDQGRVIFIDAK
ncbi:MAG: right-handed parallel beta-helix repeat-containing protein [Steroidobacteraceae bacterium]